MKRYVLSNRQRLKLAQKKKGQQCYYCRSSISVFLQGLSSVMGLCGLHAYGGDLKDSKIIWAGKLYTVGKADSEEWKSGWSIPSNVRYLTSEYAKR